MKTMIVSALFAATALLFSFGNAYATDEALPAAVVIAAIQAAVADHPGLVKEVEVERECGRLIVAVEIIDANGKRGKVKIDPQRMSSN
jgi:hypothetical protein